jgi:ribose transport system permease protein
MRLLAKGGPFLGLILVTLFFSLRPESRDFFPTYRNAVVILTQTVIVATGALGMTLIIVSGGIDLSAGSVVALASVVGARLIQHGWPIVPTVLAIVASGGLIGLFNGTMIAGLRMVPFIVTLGTLGMARGFAKWLGDDQTVNYGDSAVNGWMKPALFPTPDPGTPGSPPTGWAGVGEAWSRFEIFLRALPTGVWVTLALAALTALVLRKTVFGRHVFAIGSNEQTARLCGLPTRRLKIAIYALAGCFFGLAGLFELSRLRQGDPTVAVGLELDIIASVIIGGASLNGGSGTVLGSMIGALIMAVLRNGSQQMGWPTYYQEIIIGLVIIVAVYIDRLRQGRSGQT